MLIKSVPVGDYQTNCYLIIDEDTNDAVIVDPGDGIRTIEKFIEDNKVNLKGILLTHGHWDHSNGVKFVNSKYNAKIYVHEEDSKMMKKNISIFGELPNESEIVYIKDNDILKFNNLSFEVLYTPGHTPGGVCYKFEDVVFVGDTLFNRSIGRTDFIGGSFETLMNSIALKLLTLKDSTTVYCGHGPSTTIGYEKSYNDFLI